MKCIKCGTDNNRRERAANRGKCKRCGHPFVFSTPIKTPNSHKITDLKFKKILDNISSEDNKLFFTKKQLMYGLIRRLQNTENSVVTGFKIIIFSMVFVVFPLIPIIIVVAILSIILMFLFLVIQSVLDYWNKNKLPPPSTSSLSSSQVREWLNRWQEVNGKIEQLLPPPKDEGQQIAISDAIGALSLDRVVVCESDEIAQMLIANNFHAECSCAILSVKGYPKNIFRNLLEMLRRNPKLKVYALHSASSNGLRLAHRLRTSPRWFGQMSVPVFDLGIYPRQLFSMKTPFVLESKTSKERFKEIPAEVLKGLSEKEQKWLAAGNTLELEFLSPKKLIQVVRRGIEMGQEMEDIDEIVVFAGIPEDDDTVVAFSSSFG